MRKHSDFIPRALTAILHVIVLSAVCLFAFRKSENFLFLGYDGSYLRQLVRDAFLNRQEVFSSSLNILQGNGGTAFPINVLLSPAVQFGQAFGAGGIADPVAIYIFISIEFFLAIALLSKVMGMGRNVGWLAGWLGVFCVMPMLQQPMFYPISTIAPLAIEHVALSTLGISLSVGLFNAEHSRRTQFFFLAGIVIVLIYITYFSGASLILFLPWLSLVFLALFAFRNGRLWWMGSRLTTVAAICCGLLIFSTIVPYMLGQLAHSVSFFFNDELVIGRNNLRHISILVFGLIGMGPMNSIVFIAALSGAVVRVMREKGLAVRLCAAFLIATTALHLLGAATYVMGDKYAGVSPIYFEWFIWPLVFVLATWLAAWLGKALLSRIPGVREALIQ